MAGKSVEEERKAADADIVQTHHSADVADIERPMRMVEWRCRGLVEQRQCGTGFQRSLHWHYAACRMMYCALVKSTEVME